MPEAYRKLHIDESHIHNRRKQLKIGTNVQI
jgi:hypothetical protein